jgi:hypothetical protein
MLPAAPPHGRAPAPFTFRARTTEIRILLVLGILGAGLGLAAVGFGAWAWLFATTTYGPAAVGRWAWPWFTAAPPLSILGLAGLARAWWLGRMRVEVSDAGLRAYRGRSAVSIPWTAIREVRTRAASRGAGAFARLEVRWEARRRLHFDRTLPDLDSLVDQVKRRALPILLEDYRLRFNRGETVSLGVLTLDARGLQAGKKRIQWGAVQAVDVRAGQLLITAHEPGGTRIRIAADRMPNLDVAVQLVRLLGQVP